MDIQSTSSDQGAKWADKISRQGPWDEVEDPLPHQGAPALPMPVQISDKTSLASFFKHLKENGTHQAAANGVVGVEGPYDTEMIEFEKGVLYADGRIDLCKMVTGPPNIGDLMDSLRTNGFAKHFLLGNNIIGPKGAKAVASFINEYPDKFETWYLAGNCIDGQAFSILVDAMVTSAVVTNVWLKRNPLGSAAAKDVFRLVTGSPSLRTLDLDQTELGDAGVAQLFFLLSQHGETLPLRHLYLNATGISTSACEQISRYLASPYCKLESLYLSSNPVGDGITALAPGVQASHTLQRLSLQSCGLKDEGVIVFLTAIAHHPTLKMLNLGQAYATHDLGMRYNWLTDKCSTALINLIKTLPKLQYLNLDHQPISQAALNGIIEGAVLHSDSLLVYEVKPLVKGGRSYPEVKAGQTWVRLCKEVRERLQGNVKREYDGMSYHDFHNGPKRFIVSPQDVRLIDSVYRNRDAGLARRGLKRLEKWWDDDDETLRRVVEGGAIASVRD